MPPTKTNPNKRPNSTAEGSTPPLKEAPIRFLTFEYSDGTTEFQGGFNGPHDEMLDQTPDESGSLSYMRPIDRTEKKYWEWMKFLAESLIRLKNPELAEDVDNGRCFFFFASFPSGYRLYEHVRIPGAGGGKPRRDTYLYGHPKGPRKRYRSPQDFWKHVLWLSCDITKNPANCKCRSCESSGPTSSAPSSATPSKPTAPPTTVTVVTTADSPSPMETRTTMPVATFVPPPTAPTAPSAPPEGVLLASATYRDRMQDLQFPRLAVFRHGEQVWVKNGPHMYLGVVLEVPTMTTDFYQVLPLTSPLKCEETQPSSQPATMIRPWTLFTTPSLTNLIFQNHNVDYENLPWYQDVSSETIEVDASIVKSRDVDISYTLIEKLSVNNHYAGVYYGAERFWVGDVVRIRTSFNPSVFTGREILVVSSIKDLAPGAPYNVRCIGTGVMVTGDVYRLINHPHPLPNPAGIPTAVLMDLGNRIRYTLADPSAPYWSYIPIAINTTVRLEDVSGRWYPISAMFRILDEPKFNAYLSESGIPQPEWDNMASGGNEMGTGGQGPSRGWRRFQHRHEAFNKAITSNVTFVPLTRQTNLDVAQVQQKQQQQQIQQEQKQQEQQQLQRHQEQQQQPIEPPTNLATNPLNNPTIPITNNLSTSSSQPIPHPVIDLTEDEDDLNNPDQSNGMEFLADPDQNHDSENEFFQKMHEDAESLLADDGDFYRAL